MNAQSKARYQKNREQRTKALRMERLKTKLDGIAIYGLSLETAPDDYFYVGQTNNPKLRRTQHINESRKCQGINPEKERIIRTATTAGVKLLLTVLEIIPPNTFSDGENYWMDRLRKEGHELTNLAAGVVIYDWDGVERLAEPIAIKEFEDLEWVKDHALARKNEWYATLRGSVLLRSGWTKVRIKTAHHGEHLVTGCSKDNMARVVSTMLSQGTDENNLMIEQNKQAIRLRG